MAAPLESSVVRIYSKSGKVVGAGFLVSSKHVFTLLTTFIISSESDSANYQKN
jgi:hypothetical protein